MTRLAPGLIGGRSGPLKPTCRQTRLGHFPPFATPHGRTLPSRFPEFVAEVRLIRESATDRDLTQGGISGQHHPFGLGKAPAGYEAVRRLTHGPFEGAAEMGRAAASDHPQIPDRDIVRQMVIDIIGHPLYLPRRQSAK